MASMLEAVLSARGSWPNPTEAAIFGTDDAEQIADILEGFVEATTGTIDAVRFYLVGVGVVAAVRLTSGRDVVVKVHRHNVSVSRLGAVHQVQAHLSGQGLPAPRPVVSPTHLGQGIAVVEEFLPGGDANGLRPLVRRSIARGLQTFIAAASEMDPVPAVGERNEMRPKSSLYGEPHDVRFDFDATAHGAEWIDDHAAAALERLDSPAPLSIGHLDWRVENLGFDGDELAAIYDWDSVWLAPEPVTVGQASAAFSTDWRIGAATFPTVNDMRAFVADYEEARGQALSLQERELADAANRYVLAYGARCEHSDHMLFGLNGPKPFATLLRHRGESFLAPI